MLMLNVDTAVYCCRQQRLQLQLSAALDSEAAVADQQQVREQTRCCDQPVVPITACVCASAAVV